MSVNPETRRDKGFLGAGATAVWAHRGASAVRPENTLEAFLEARRMGADGVELDVRRTLDGALAVHHDAFLPDGRAVVACRVADLPPSVPLLDAALDACADLVVNIEIKNFPHEPDHDPHDVVAAAVATLVAERRAHGSVVVSSFRLATIDAVVAADPGIRCGLLQVPGSDAAQALDLVLSRGHAALHPHHSGVDAALVEAAHEAGVAVHTWTVDDPDRLGRLAACGVDAVVTNVPDVALAVLAR